MLLTQGLGATLSIVYLTEELTDATEANLVPIVAYPEEAALWNKDQIISLLSAGLQIKSPSLPVLGSAEVESERRLATETPGQPPSPSSAADAMPLFDQAQLAFPQQIVLPLMHNGVVMGLLVTARADRVWVDREQAQIERIARTLSLACAIDQRAQWAEQDLEQQRLLKGQQQEQFDDLLHQFRNPLTALKTFGKLLVRRLMPQDDNYGVAEGIVRESDRLQELLRQFERAVELGETALLPGDKASGSALGAQVHSRELEDGSRRVVPLLPGANALTGEPLRCEPHQLAEVVEPLLGSAQAIAQDRQLELRAIVPPHLPPVLVDVKALREVLNNLIDNALKYTPAGGRVDIILGLQRSDAKPPMQGVAVIDTGPGIPPDDLPHLFQRHFRGVQSQGDIPGTGLGLAIAHDLVRQMQGEIQVFSPAQESGLAPGKAAVGTAFTLWLPEAMEPMEPSIP